MSSALRRFSDHRGSMARLTGKDNARVGESRPTNTPSQRKGDQTRGLELSPGVVPVLRVMRGNC